MADQDNVRGAGGVTQRLLCVAVCLAVCAVDHSVTPGLARNQAMRASNGNGALRWWQGETEAEDGIRLMVPNITHVDRKAAVLAVMTDDHLLVE